MDFFKRNYATKMADKLYKYAQKYLAKYEINISELALEGGIIYSNQEEKIDYTWNFLGKRSPDFIIFDENMKPKISLNIMEGNKISGLFYTGDVNEEGQNIFFILPPEEVEKEEAKFFLNVLYQKYDLEKKYYFEILKMNLSIFKEDYIDYIASWNEQQKKIREENSEEYLKQKENLIEQMKVKENASGNGK